MDSLALVVRVFALTAYSDYYHPNSDVSQSAS